MKKTLLLRTKSYISLILHASGVCLCVFFSFIKDIGKSKKKYTSLTFSAYTKIAFLFFFYSFLTTTKLFAQFSETWSLATSTAQTGNTGTATTGNTETIGSGMNVPTYGTYQTFTKPGGVNWPGTVNTANGIYVEFPITPTAGNNLVITNISFSGYINNGSGGQEIINIYDGTTAVGSTGTITSTTAGTPTNVSITGLSISVPNGTTKYIRFYITGNNSRTLNLKNIVISGTSTSAFCAQATLSANTVIAADNIGLGTTGNLLTDFSIAAQTNLSVTGFSFPFTNTALVSTDLLNYKLYYTSTNTFSSPTLLSTVSTALATSPINFSGFTQAIVSGNAGYFWVTADVAGGATSGHSITAAALTATNVTFSGAPTTCGSVTAQGKKTIIVLTVPTVTTTTISGITSTTATTGGNVTNDGGSTVIERGLIYSTGAITDTTSISGGGKIINVTGGLGTYTTSLTGLSPATTYHVKTFAVNSAGVSYGADSTFTTPPTPARDCSTGAPLDGSAAKEGAFTLYAYAKAGEQLDWNIIRTEDNNAANWTIKVYTPTGLYSTCTIGNTIGNLCNTPKIPVTGATEGIWTLVATPAGADGNDVVCPSLNVYTSGGASVSGRVWTESLHGHDVSTGVEPDFTLYFLTPGGYEYSATYSGMNGLNYTIVSDSLGVRTSTTSCTSAYQSISYSGANPGVGPDNANCGKKDKIFLTAFAADLPASAPRFNVTAGSGQVTEPLISTPVIPTLSNPTYIRTTSCSGAGTINFTVSNFSGTGIVYIDVNNNGIFSDAVDVIDTVTFVNGVNTTPFNGIDGLGHAIPVSQAMNVKVVIAKIGETHFVQSDIEIFGGISVTRLNGPGAPSSTLYWNDTNLPTTNNCSVTPLIDGRGGVNSSGSGVHDWTLCSGDTKASGSNTNNSTINHGSWGNQRLIDNWAYVTDSTLNHTIYVPPLADTTYKTVCSNQLPYVWNGSNYSATGIYNVTFTSSGGCDSVVTLVLTINQASTSTINVHICPSSLPYFWNGHSYTSDTTATLHFTNAVGCDSAATLILAVYANPVTNNTTLSNCKSITFEGITYTGNATVSDTIRSIGGCDSIYNITTIAINPIAAVTNNTTLSNCNSVTFEGITYTGNATVNDTVKSIGGCDSIYNITTIAINPIATVTNNTTLSNCKSITFEGITYTGNATVNDTVKSIGGCDSIYNITTIAINPIATVTNNTTLSNCSSVTFEGITYTGNATVNDTVKSIGGCDSIYNITTIAINPIATVTNNTTLSNCSSVTFEGITYTGNATVSDTVKSIGGCDSIYNITAIAINPIATVTNNTTLSNCSSVTFEGITYTGNATVNDTVKSIGGCDSIYNITTIAINPITTVTNNTTLSNCNSVTFEGITYTGNATVSDTVKSIGGCDSIYNITAIAINPIAAVTNNTTLSNCSSVTFEGITYTGNATVNDTVKSIGGCDSIYNITTIAINPIAAVTNNTTLSNCNSVTFEGITYTGNATVNDTVKSIGGCDSIYNITAIAINPITAVTNNTTLSNCNSVTFEGITYTGNATVNDTVKSIGGCDSIYNITTIAINPIAAVTNNTTLSNCSSVTFEGITYTGNATVNDTVKSIGGCDSIYNITTIAINPIAAVTNNTTLSNCNSVTFEGITYTGNATVSDTIRNTGGCDSVYNITTITINPIATVTNNTTLSNCNSVTFEGITYTGNATVSDTVKSTGGCDSIYNITTIAINPIAAVTNNTTLSNCNSVTFEGITYTGNATVSDTIRSIGGCDSIYNITAIAINPIATVTNNTTLSNCNSVTFEGITYTGNATVNDTVKSTGGCDSIYNITTIAINPIATVTNNTTLSNCSSVTFEGITYTGNATVSDTIRNTGGCDSVYNITTITINPIAAVTNNTTLSNCSSVTFEGITYTGNATVNDTVKSIGGCDSIYNITTIAINPITATANNTTLSNCSSVTFEGITYTGNATVNDTVKSIGGCDSIYNITTIAINPITAVTNNTTLSNCNSITFEGITYTGNATVNDTVKSIGGCDSIYNITTIAINPIAAVTNNTTLSNCNSVTFEGITYTGNATVSDTVKSIGGCDSIYNITAIAINPIAAVTNNTTLSNCSSVTFEGITYTGNATVNDTVKSIGGCDSIYNITTIAINPIAAVTNNTTLSNCNSVTFEGITYTGNATVNDTVKSIGGCDSIYNITTIAINPIAAVTNNTTLSNCNSVTFEGITYTGNATVNDTVKSIGGCDSIYNITTIAINPIAAVTNNTTLSNCSSVTFEGITYTGNATVSDTIRSIGGCDSIYNITTITINPIATVTNNTTLSNCSSVTFEGITYTGNATVNDTVKSIGGCDSIYNITTIAINPIAAVTNNTTLSNCNSVTFEGITYTGNATVSDTIRSIGGCDSIYNITTIAINPIATVTNNTTLSNCNSVTFEGITYTGNATVSDTVKSIGGCDSIYNITAIAINPIAAVTNNTTLSNCNSVTFEGITYTGNATVSDTVKSIGGCDSIYNITAIAINPIAAVTNNTTLSNCSSVTFEGITYTGNATVNDTVKSIGGCDSIYNITTIAINPIAAVTNNTTLSNCNSVTFEGITYTGNATVNDTVKSIGGCDSIYNITTIAINPIAAVTNNTTLSNCNSVTFEGITYTGNATVSDTIRSIGGCDSIYNITTITINPIATVTNNTTLSNCSSVTFEGITYTGNATVSDTVKSTGGCDSIYNITTIAINPIAAVTNNTTLSNCNSVTFEGITYTGNATVNDTVKSIGGCDSIYNITTIAINPIAAVTNNTTLSNCNSVTFEGITYTGNATVSDTVKSTGGCDSIYNITTIAINPIAAVTNNTTLSNCSSVTFEGITYTGNATVSDTIRSIGGCDSIYNITTITINPIATVTNNTTLSNCSSVTFEGITYTGNATVSDTVKSTGGCDSIYNITTIAINPIATVTNNTTLSNCNSVTFEGITYTGNATVSDTIRNTGGCDSVYNITTITINPIATVTNNTTLSNCNSVTFEGITYTGNATVSDTIRSIGGCDSIYNITTIAINPIAAVTNNTTLSNCKSITFEGITYTGNATVSDTIRNTGGCDSVYNITTITINPIAAVTNNTTLSNCKSITFEGITYTGNATVSDTIRSIGGCDSIYNITAIAINPIATVTNNTTLSNCKSITFEGITYTGNATVNDTVKSTGGCDSIYNITTIAINPIATVTNNTTLSNCKSITFEGITYTGNATVNDTVKSIGGCDSIYNITAIAINPIAAVTNNTTLSNCNSVTFEGITYTGNATVSDTVKSIGGCDSIYNITAIAINPIAAVTNNTTLSNCSSVTFEGITYTGNATVNDTVKSTGGCDSIYNIANIVITPIAPVTSNTALSSCNSATIKGITYTSTTVVRDTVKSTGGCDSAYHIIAVTINPITPITKNTAFKNCNSIIIGGITYTASTTLHDTLRSIGGCDSIYHITTITINPIEPVIFTDHLSSCHSIVFNGTTYASSATLRDTVKATGGCDSVYHITAINIHPIVPVTIQDSVVGCRNVVVNGVAYSASTLLSTTLQSMGGCDSVYKVTNIIVSTGQFDLSLSASGNNVTRGTIVSVIAGASGAYSITAWQPASLFPSQTAGSQQLEVDSITHIAVTAESAAGCLATASLVLNIKLPTDFYVPNAFTPNADGKNDRFNVYGTGISHGLLRIYNQWGQLLYETTDITNIQKGWDGNFKGVPQPVGVYAYTVEAVMDDGSQNSAHGFLNLIR